MSQTGEQPIPPERSVSWELKRMDILKKAATTFSEEGYHETSVGSLAASMRVSKPVLYYYAKNKDDLLFQCGEVARDELRQAMDSALRLKISGMGRVRRFFSAYVEIMCSAFGRCLTLVEPRALSPEARSKDAATRRELEGGVRQMIIEGQADGSVGACDPVLATRAIFGAFNGIPRWFNPEGALRAHDVADSYIDLFVRGMGRG